MIPYLRPDGKTQVTVRYEDGRPVEIVKVLISTQHKPDIDGETLIKPDLWSTSSSRCCTTSTRSCSPRRSSTRNSSSTRPASS